MDGIQAVGGEVQIVWEPALCQLQAQYFPASRPQLSEVNIIGQYAGAALQGCQSCYAVRAPDIENQLAWSARHNKHFTELI
jgi:hypothetical protein